MLSKSQKADRIAKLKATVAKRQAAQIRHNAEPRKSVAPAAPTNHEPKTNGAALPLVERVAESLTLMQEGLDWLLATHGEHVFDRMDRAHQKFLLARQALMAA